MLSSTLTGLWGTASSSEPRTPLRELWAVVQDQLLIASCSCLRTILQLMVKTLEAPARCQTQLRLRRRPQMRFLHSDLRCVTYLHLCACISLRAKN